MATIDSLANETLIHIMEMLKGPSLVWDSLESPQGRYDSLRAAALVCRRWKDPAQVALFDEVVITDHFPRRTERFLASPALPRHHTRSLYAATATGPGPKEPDWLQVAEACTGLKSLQANFRNGATTEAFTRPCFAGLEHLSITGVFAKADPLIHEVRLPMRLSSLALWSRFDEQPAIAFLTAAGTSSVERLDKIHLRVPPELHDDRLVQALRVLGPHLRTFIMDYEYNNPEDHLDIFPAFTALESFVWYAYLPRSLLKASNVENLPSILDAFPSRATLRHLSIGTNDFTSLRRITTLLGHPALTLLKKLDFPSLPSSTPAKDFSVVVAMAKACEDRGIQWSMAGVAMGL